MWPEGHVNEKWVRCREESQVFRDRWQSATEKKETKNVTKKEKKETKAG